MERHYERRRSRTSALRRAAGKAPHRRARSVGPQFWLLALVLSLGCLLSHLGPRPSSALPTDAPLGSGPHVGPRDKFIPSFTIKYGSARENSLDAGQTAKFDMLIASPGHHQVWGESGRNSWLTLREYNPDMVIAIYAAGPGAYNTASWGELGAGWDWLVANHGLGTTDQWTAEGFNYGDYLQHRYYPDTRCMDLANPDWQQYWIDAYYDDRFGGARGQDHRGADAIFADVTGYEVTGAGAWHREGDPAATDHPRRYYDGEYDHELWRRDMNAFLLRAVPQLAAKDEHVKLIPNFGRLDSHPEYWSELEGQPHPPFAAMQEGGLVKSYGRYTFNYHQWAQKIEAMKERRLPVLMTCHGKAGDYAGVEGLDRMDVPVEDGIGTTTGWEALWFAIAGFLMALNEDGSNGYLSFTVWSYSEYHWLDEFDPRFLHLGAPLDESYVQDGIWFREYEDGWVVANPPYGEVARALTVPYGQARVVDHARLRSAESQPLVDRFDLPSARAVVLLKPGRMIGSEDNPAPEKLQRLFLPLLDVAGNLLAKNQGARRPDRHAW